MVIFPKIQLACVKDELRPIMEVVHINKQHVVATDSHILVVHDSASLLTDDFINNIPDGGCNIHRDDFAKFAGKECELSWKSKGIIRVTYSKRKRPILIECEEDNKYIDYMHVIPDEKIELTAQTSITINSKLLHTLQTAMTVNGDACEIKCYGTTHAMMVAPVNGTDTNNVKGLIMPMFNKNNV